MGGWNFLQALSETSQTHIIRSERKTQNVYVHPMVKRSSSMLSPKSLEMCTESLGSETGSNSAKNSDDIALLSRGSVENGYLESHASRSCVSRRSNWNRDTFPPPLTSIANSRGVQVWPLREDGRLVLKLVTCSSNRPVFHAERGNGKLTLRLLEGSDSDSDDELVDDKELVEENCNDGDKADIDVQEEEEECENETEEVCWDEELEQRSYNSEGEMSIGKLPRHGSRRCKEGRDRDKELLTREPFWVAT